MPIPVDIQESHKSTSFAPHHCKGLSDALPIEITIVLSPIDHRPLVTVHRHLNNLVSGCALPSCESYKRIE
jgi:hypothetical protein